MQRSAGGWRSEAMGDRCTGHCCRSFRLDTDRVAMVDGVATWVGARAMDAEDAFVLDMLVPVEIAPCPSHPDLAVWGTPLDPDKTYAVAQFWSCRHFDGSNCTVYEQRPGMCRNYPGRRGCDFKNCTWDYAKYRGSCPALAPVTRLEEPFKYGARVRTEYLFNGSNRRIVVAEKERHEK